MAGIFAASFLAAAGLALFGYCFPIWNVTLYGISLAMITVSAGLFAYSIVKSRNKSKPLLKTAVFAGLTLAVFSVITYYLNNIYYRTTKPAKAAFTVTCIFAFVFAILFVITLAVSNGKTAVKAICVLLSAVLLASSFIPITVIPKTEKKVHPAMNPTGLSSYTEKDEVKVDNADFYVSSDGSDSNDGSIGKPFATIERARDAVRELDKTEKNGVTVAVKAGEYRVSGLTFGEEDSGTESCPVTYSAYGDGEVILNGGLTIAPEDFSEISDEEVLSRLSEDAMKNVLCADLAKLGLTKDDWGKIYAIGSYNTAAKYDGDYVGGQYCELFVNDKRMTVARYPNEGFLVTDRIIETGEGRESNGSQTRNENYENLRNPKGDTYQVSKKLADRINSWKTLDDVWMFGFFKYTWADASTLIEKFDFAKRELTTKFVSVYGTSDDGTYYFFNVLEELDSPGEWYLDRENGILYLYPDTDISSATVDFSVTSDNIISVSSDYLTFRGFTVKGTRGDAINITGNNNTVERCLVKNIGGNAICLSGNNNLAYANEITHTGKGGIYLNGGDTALLTPGNNKADNNLIHDWSEVFQTYQPAVALGGVGNICSHNEIYNSPHEAITYSGNNHQIEYNNIHDVCLLSDDAGAIYSGRRWDWYGNVIRYNAIYNIYSEGHAACGIYLDDALSGQEVFGNILVNVGSIGLHLGGGRDLTVKNNLVINCFDTSVSYDDRARDGALNNGWFDHSAENGDMWKNFEASPWKSEVWQKAFPQYKHFSFDFSDPDNPDFAVNPAYSDVSCNIIVNETGNIGNISDSANFFGSVGENYVYETADADALFENYISGDYSVKDLPDGFGQIPYGEIGRY